jgi:hypothetical protein
MRPALLLILLAALPVRADDLEALRAENARLRARVDHLERETAALRGLARAAEPAIPTRVVERNGPGGTLLWATEPGRLDVTGGSRAVHWLWMERTAGGADATLWIRGEFSGGGYRSTERLELRFDGTGHALPIVSYDATRITSGVGRRPLRRDHELLSVRLAPPVLAALGHAAAMTGRLGRTSFTVPPEVLASLRALARKHS